MKFESIFLILTLLFSVITMSSALAQPQTSFYAKGIVTGEHFEDAVMWTSIKDTEGVFISQWELGRTKIHVTLSPIESCEPEYKICQNAIVTKSTNSAAVPVGDKFTIKINTENKKQIITGIEGFLENVDVIVEFTKIHDKTNYKQVDYADNRPNILLIVLDDVGFADLGFTSSEISTPTMNSLANEEILMTNFHVSPTCSPTRAMMLTGVDNHLNGFGTMNEALADNQKGKPGYETFLNNDVVTVATLLHDSGYHTYMSGKWHLGYGGVTPNVEENWDEWINYDPYSRGFEETFSGGIPGNHFSDMGIGPGHAAFYTRNGEKVTLPDDFYSANSYTDYLIEFINKNQGDGQPMFMYLPFWTSHFPLHAPAEYIEKYDGVYDKGWDEIRKERFEKQKTLGLIPQDLKLPERLPTIPAWDELSPEEQAYEAKKMQIFAAMTDITDENIGRVIDHLKEIGEYDNTLILVFSDNGPESAEVTKHAPVHGFDQEAYQKFMNQFDNSLENIGFETSNVSLGAGWAQVGSSPLLREKTFVTEGGTRVPMIIKVPGNSVNFQTNAFSSVLDITPTVLDYADVEHPGTMYHGHKIHQMSGKSLKPLFEEKVVRVYGEDEPFGMELFGNSALYKGDWKALRLVPPSGSGEWKLFNLAEDVRELTDLSSEYPEILNELIMDYDSYAERVGVIIPEGLDFNR